jgi:hypothetical protein
MLPSKHPNSRLPERQAAAWENSLPSPFSNSVEMVANQHVPVPINAQDALCQACELSCTAAIFYYFSDASLVPFSQSPTLGPDLATSSAFSPCLTFKTDITTSKIKPKLRVN